NRVAGSAARFRAASGVKRSARPRMSATMIALPRPFIFANGAISAMVIPVPDGSAAYAFHHKDRKPIFAGTKYRFNIKSVRLFSHGRMGLYMADDRENYQRQKLRQKIATRPRTASRNRNRTMAIRILTPVIAAPARLFMPSRPATAATMRRIR